MSLCNTSYFGTSAKENSVRQSAYSSAAPQRELQICNPLLYALLKGEPPSSPETNNADIELGTGVTFSDGRRCKSRQVKSSLAALDCGPIQDHSGGTHSKLYQQQVSSPSLRCPPSVDKGSPVGEPVPSTDDEIHSYIARRLAHFRTILNQKNGNDGDSGHARSCSSQREHAEKQSLHRAETAQFPRSAAAGQAPEEDGSDGGKANVELTPKSEMTRDCATSASGTRATGTLTSAVGNSKHAPKTESVEKSASVNVDLPLTKRLDLTVPANGDGELVCSDDCEDKTLSDSTGESFHSKLCDKYLSTGMTTLHYSLTALKELIASLENVGAIAQGDNASKTILQQYWNGNVDNVHLFTSTEYPQIMVNVAATCTKREDESPVVLTAVSEMALDQLTKKHPSSSQEGHESPWLDINKSMDDGVSCAPQHMTEGKNVDTGLRPVEDVGLDNVKGVADVSEVLKTRSSSAVPQHDTFELTSLVENQDASTKKKKKDEPHCSVTRKEYIAHSSEIQIHNVVSIPTNRSKWLCSRTSRAGARRDVASVCSQTDISRACSENRVKEQAARSESNSEEAQSFLKVPQYEDISDKEVVPEPNNKRSPVKNEGYGHVLPQYEDISDEEVVPEPNNKRSPVENEGYGHAQGQAKMKSGIIPKSPSFVSEDEDEIDQMDGGWLVIPISMSDLTFEPRDEDQDGSETVVLDGGETGDKEKSSEPHRPGSKPVPEAFAPPIEEFDTVDSFMQAKAVKFEKEPHTPQDRIQVFSEHEDSSETEDSCDYSSGSEHNYMTVSLQFLKKRSAHLPPATDDSVSEKEDKKKRRQLIDANVCNNRVQHETNGQTISKSDDIVILDSDIDDESDQNYKEKAKRRRLFSSGSEDRRDAPCSRQRRHSPKSVRSLSPSAGSPAPQRQSRLKDTRFKEAMQEAASDLSHGAGKSFVTKAGTEQGRVIILDSDTDDDQNSGRENRKRSLSLGSMDGGDAPPPVRQKRRSPETVNAEYGAVEEKLPETKPSSDLSPLPRRPPVLQDAQLREATQGVRKTEPLIEANGGSERVHQQTNRQVSEERQIVVSCDSNRVVKHHFSKNKANTKRIQSSGSEDSDGATKSRPSTETMVRLCGTTSQKPKLSSENSTKKQPQPVDKEADDRPLGAYRVIPRLYVQESFPTLRLVKKDSKVLMRGKDETPKTPTAARKMTDWHLRDRNEEGRSVPNSKPTNDGYHATKNTVQTNVAKPRLVSSQLSSPSHEGPSGSGGSSSSTGGRLSEARQSSASSGLLKSKQSTSVPRHVSPSKLQRSLSWSNPSNSDHLGPPQKGPSPPAPMQSSARMRVKKDWNDCYFSTRRDRKGSERLAEDRRTTNSDLSRKARPRRLSHYDKAPKQRPNSHKPATRLMKQTMSDYKQWTNARSRDAPREQRYSVGEGYKWSEKPTVAKP